MKNSSSTLLFTIDFLILLIICVPISSSTNLLSNSGSFLEYQKKIDHTVINDIPIPDQHQIERILDINQKDLDGDNLPDITIINCSFTTDNDIIYVFDQGEDMQTSADWQKSTDFINDIWIFDANDDGSTQLIIDFNVVEGQYVALIYDDTNGDADVAYHIEKNNVMIDESSYWHIQIVSSIPWDQPDSLYNAELTFIIDGYAGYLLYLGTNNDFQDKGIDGIVDWQLDIGDINDDGINDYQLQRAISQILIDKFILQFPTAIYTQVINRKPIPYSSTVFWPLLVSKHNYEVYRYFDHPPAVAVDWETGTIDRIGILGYPIEEGYHIYSRLPIEKNTINEADFENPMAYYDMADDQDNWPELQVRFQVAVPYDPYFPTYPYQGTVDTPNVEVNYSWDQDNDNRWDYKMNLGANSAIDEVVNFPDFAIKTMPYDEILPWVRNQSWDVAMLVFDGQPSQDSEGMFNRGWMIDRGYVDGGNVEPAGLSTNYMVGFRDEPPEEYYKDIQDFMRGEYSFNYFDTPIVYQSALDRQLHLYHPESGIWNLSGGNYIRYANLKGDPYLDQWQEEQDGIVVQQVNYSDGFYVYSGNDSVILLQTDVQPALFESQPPGFYEEWLRLNEQLKANEAIFLPTDFVGMLAQLSGQQGQIQAAVVRDFLPTANGFRFVLELLPGFSLNGPDLLGLQGQEAGEYMVSYDGVFLLTPLTAPILQINLDTTPLISNPPTEFANQHVKVILTNKGLEDAKEVLVSFGTSQSGQEITWTEDQTVTVLAGETTPISFPWAPDASGVWWVLAQAKLLDPGQANNDPITVHQAVIVKSAQDTTLKQEMSAFGVIAPWQMVLLMSCVVVSAGLAGWVLIRTMKPQENLPSAPVSKLGARPK